MPVDNRMLWIRNLDGLDVDTAETAEAELGSEAQVFGMLDYNNGAILCGLATGQPDEHGLYKYVLRLAYPPDTEYDWTQVTKKGYVYRDGTFGELSAIISFYLRVRMFVLSYSELRISRTSAPHKVEFSVLRRRVDPRRDPIVFGRSYDRNFIHGLPGFLDTLRHLPQQHHYPVMMAIDHYARSLREIGLDDEMVFVRLVSAVEAASGEFRPTDALSTRKISELVNVSVLSPSELKEIEKLFATRRAKARFVEFLDRYSKGFIKGGRTKAPHTRVTRSNLRDLLSNIYDARSNYLHRGDPMYLSEAIPHDPKWHTDATVGRHWQSRKFTTREKMPYIHFFHRLVRHALLAYIEELATSRPANSR